MIKYEGVINDMIYCTSINIKWYIYKKIRFFREINFDKEGGL